MKKKMHFRQSLSNFQKILVLILFIFAFFSVTPSMADEYELNAQNLPDGRIIVTFDLIVDPGLSEVYLNNQYFTHFENLTEFNKSTKKGYPEVLSKQVALSVDPDMEYTLQIVESEYETYDLDSPYLVGRGKITRNQNPENIPYIVDKKSRKLKKYPEKQIEFEENFLIRNVSGFNFQFNITEFNIRQNRVKIYTHLEFELVPDGDGTEYNATLRDTEVTPEINRILPHLFLNYEDNSIAQMYKSRSSSGDMLVIYTARDENAIQPYIQHKQSLGFNVQTIKVATGTNVKSTIQNAYNQNPNLFYVQLVGDWADIKSDLGTDQNAPMDPMLGCVKGNDNYPDLIVGRFSASSASDVTTQVNKTIAYEQNPGLSFWGNALGIGSGEGPGDDGEKDYEHIDVIKENKLLPNQYSNVSEVYSSGSASQVAAFVNNGTHVINYCGHGSATSWGTTGFSSSNVNSLTNGNKLPIIFSVACVNGQFHTGTCFAESWLRKSNGGAIATIMSTINQPWNPPMRGQDYMNDLLTGGYNYSNNPGTGTSTSSGKDTIGEIVLNAFSLMYAESSSTSDLETISTWTLFGDASLLVVGGSGSVTYALNVNNGSGSGNYTAGTTVTIKANAAPSGQVFDKWIVNTGGPAIANVNASSTTLTMPANTVTVTATYKATGGTGNELTEGGVASDGGASNPAAETESKAFDNNNATKWLVYSNTGIIQYDFSGSTAYAVNEYRVTSANDVPGRDPKNWNFQGSNNGTNWTTLDSRSNITFSSRFETKVFQFSNSTGYQMYRLQVTANNGSSYLQIAELQLFGQIAQGTGKITRQVWTGITGTTITALTGNANYPNNPNSTNELTSFEAPTNWADNYGTRIVGYLHAPVTGTYTFWIASDDYGELWLSTNDSAANKKRIAYVPGWSSSRQWTKFTQQKSVGISLTTGQRYYIEALQKEGGGGDNLAVAWQRPGGAQEVIPGNYLSPYSSPGTNVAVGKATSQSSTYPGAVASRAVDGNTNGQWSAGSVSHTNNQSKAWWQVNLGATHTIHNVTLWNRTDCCGNRLSDFHVDALDKNGNVIATKNYPGTAGVTTDINLSASGVYAVRVQLNGSNYLQLAEVEVMGSAN